MVAETGVGNQERCSEVQTRRRNGAKSVRPGVHREQGLRSAGHRDGEPSATSSSLRGGVAGPQRESGGGHLRPRGLAKAKAPWSVNLGRRLGGFSPRTWLGCHTRCGRAGLGPTSPALIRGSGGRQRMPEGRLSGELAVVRRFSGQAGAARDSRGMLIAMRCFRTRSFEAFSTDSYLTGRPDGNYLARYQHPDRLL